MGCIWLLWKPRSPAILLPAAGVELILDRSTRFWWRTETRQQPQQLCQHCTRVLYTHDGDRCGDGWCRRALYNRIFEVWLIRQTSLTWEDRVRPTCNNICQRSRPTSDCAQRLHRGTVLFIEGFVFVFVSLRQKLWVRLGLGNIFVLFSRVILCTYETLDRLLLNEQITWQLLLVVSITM